MNRTALTALAMVPLLTSCAGTGKESPTDFCANASAIYTDQDDKITDATSRQILSHNLTGVKLCGWGKRHD